MPQDADPIALNAFKFPATCASNSDCPAGRKCYPFYYQWDDSGSFDDASNGVTCMVEDTGKCQDSNDMFAYVNENYSSTGSDFKTTYKCTFAAN